MSNATTDWTPILEPLTKGCELVDLNKIPTSYQSSIISKKHKGNIDKDSYEKITIVLKDAMAFGYPLKKIESDKEISQGGQIINFKNAEFMNARSKFKLPALEGWTVQNNDASGYTLEATEGMDSGMGLEFNKTKKTITCSFA